ncbi:MAG: hypothetical protein CMJ78_07695 [Planctomycetaceae bacterium]|nr:hypothetical protein [Planctomycetaceae bacterium]
MLPVVKFLLDQGCDPLLTPSGRNLLSSAAWNKYARGVITELISRGADPNAVDSRIGATPLMRAIDDGNARAIEEFLAGGADPNLRWPKSNLDCSEMTAVEYATKEKKKKIIELLESAPTPGTSKPAKAAKPTSTSKRLPTMAASWKRLSKHLEESHPDMLESLNGGATEAQLRELSHTDIRVTKEVKDLLSQHNGQSDSACLIRLESKDEQFRLLTTSESLAEWKIWQELNEDGDFEDLEATVDAGVRDCWWYAKWLPIASNGGGDCVCVDFSPAKGGKQGQVITVWHEEGERNIVFASVREMLAEVTEYWCGQ